MRRTALLLLAAVLMGACVDEPVAGSRPTSTRHQLVGGAKLAIATISNKSQQFGLENALSSTLLDEFLRDGRYQIVPLKESDDVIAITITRYLLAPIGYDVTLAPISYKLRIICDLSLVDRATGKTLWTEKNLEGSLTYPNPNLSGGMSESQAQAVIWTVLSPMIVERIAEGAPAAPPGVSTGTAASPDVSTAPATAPPAEPR